MLNINNSFACIMDTPLGKLGIKMHDGNITAVDYLSAETTHDDPFISAQLNTYFSNPHHVFTLPVAPAGTPFQQRVWQALCGIPAGTTLTYGTLAKTLNSSPRAVGQACRRNPIPIIIPCHRVVGVNDLGGYAGEKNGKLLEIKQWLITHEVNRIAFVTI